MEEDILKTANIDAKTDEDLMLVREFNGVREHISNYISLLCVTDKNKSFAFIKAVQAFSKINQDIINDIVISLGIDADLNLQLTRAYVRGGAMAFFTQIGLPIELGSIASESLSGLDGRNIGLVSKAEATHAKNECLSELQKYQTKFRR